MTWRGRRGVPTSDGTGWMSEHRAGWMAQDGPPAATAPGLVATDVPPDVTTPGPGRPSRRTVTALVAVFSGLLIGAAGNLVHLPYAVMLPGPAANVLGQEAHEDGQQRDLIAIEGHATYPTTGALDFTTVRVNGGPGYPVTVWDLVGAWFDKSQAVYPVDALFPPQQTAADVQSENQAEMVDSQQEAAAVALRKLGIAVPERIKVGQVAKDAPSAGVLKVGDVITSVGAVAVTSADSVRAAIQQATPGQPVDIVVQRAGAAQTVRPMTGKSPDGRTVLGIVLGVDFVFPFSVKIDVGAVGGPSAGLMFSLGIYDKLTDGALTGGRNIAGTGTIDSAGAVGPIGGIRQKMVGARRSGATFFLAPADNCDEVRGHEPDGMEVVKVATFDEAERAVASIGTGDLAGLPHC